MANKFYYNGKLVRTSKTHVYTHAVINDNGDVLRCSANEKLARSFMTSEISRAETTIRDCDRAIKAIQNGEKGYYSRDYGQRNLWISFSTFHITIEKCESEKQACADYIRQVQGYKIVELVQG